MRTLCGLAMLLWAGLASAHVGSPDVFLEGKAGPYPVFVTVRPPEVIPGVADVEVRVPDGDGVVVHVVPAPLLAQGAQFAPLADLAKPLGDEKNAFSGHLWMMSLGSWQVRVSVEGPRGSGVLAVPVPALPMRTKQMQSSLGMLLGALAVLLVLALGGIVAGAAREATLAPGAEVERPRAMRARWVGILTFVLASAGTWGGWRWWQAEARAYDQKIYKPLGLAASVEKNGERARLRLTMVNPPWLHRSAQDLLPDHDHLMHLFMVSTALDQVWHLHPARDPDGVFSVELPTVPAGTYRLYADIVHVSGVPETATGELSLPAPVGSRVLDGDDAAGLAPKFGAATTRTAPFGDGGQLVWLDDEPLRAQKAHAFRFRIEDRPGHPAEDVELYMGMLGHGMFVVPDGSMFAHIHPSGSVPMAALLLTDAVKDPHAHHQMGVLPSEVGFFYGLPKAGSYRLFVQVKRGGKIETAAFDVKVEP